MALTGGRVARAELLGPPLSTTHDRLGLLVVDAHARTSGRDRLGATVTTPIGTLKVAIGTDSGSSAGGAGYWQVGWSGTVCWRACAVNKLPDSDERPGVLNRRFLQAVRRTDPSSRILMLEDVTVVNVVTGQIEDCNNLGHLSGVAPYDVLPAFLDRVGTEKSPPIAHRRHTALLGEIDVSEREPSHDPKPHEMQVDGMRVLRGVDDFPHFDAVLGNQFRSLGCANGEAYPVPGRKARRTDTQKAV